MSDLITYDDKIRLKSQNVSEKYKVTAGDMNEIKSVVNTNAEEVDEINKPENWVSVGTTAPTDGRRVFFAHSKNVLQHSAYDRTLNGVTLKVNDDKSITLTGTASANTNFNIGTNSTLTLKAGTYTFTKGATNVQLLIYYSSASVLCNLPIGTSSQTITINSDTTYENYRVVISIPNGTQTNETVYPMLRLSTTSNTYEPYVEKSINVDDEQWLNKTNLVSVGATSPTGGERVWFGKSKNLLQYKDFVTKTQSGVTFTQNNDGTYKVNGTATADISLVVYDVFIPMSGTWRLVGCPSGGSSSTYMLSAYVNYWGSSSPNIDTGDGTNITYTGNVKIRFYIKSGTTCNNLIFKPMMTYDTSATYDTFEPYIDEGIYVDNEQWYSKPKVLWSGKATSVDIDLRGYSFIEVIFCSNDNFYNSLKVPVSGSTFSRNLALCNSYLSDPMESSGSLYLKYGKATLTQSGITIKSNVEVAITNTASQIRWQGATNTLLYITTIIGYK